MERTLKARRVTDSKAGPQGALYCGGGGAVQVRQGPAWLTADCLHHLLPQASIVSEAQDIMQSRSRSLNSSAKSFEVENTVSFID